MMRRRKRRFELQVYQQLSSALVTLIRVFGQRLRHRPGQIRRYFRTDAIKRLRLAALDRGENRALVIPRKGPASGEHLVEQGTQEPEVAPAVYGLSAGLLG